MCKQVSNTVVNLLRGSTHNGEITSKGFGLTCTIKELRERNENVVLLSRVSGYWRYDGQSHVLPFRPSQVSRSYPIGYWRDFTALVVGIADKPKQIHSTGFYADLSHQHSELIFRD